MTMKCSICTEVFRPQDDICSPKCGHLFHRYCILQWIKTSKTCPQCRCKATTNSMRKIYLNIEDTTQEIDMDIAVKIYQMECEQNVKLGKELQEQEKKTLELKSAIHASEEYVNKLQNENQRLKEKVNSLLKDNLDPNACDGLGGDVKEEFYPSAIPPTTNLKRKHSSESTTSAKCKKLAHDSQSN